MFFHPNLVWGGGGEFSLVFPTGFSTKIVVFLFLKKNLGKRKKKIPGEKVFFAPKVLKGGGGGGLPCTCQAFFHPNFGFLS